jgi:hypothetical protein
MRLSLRPIIIALILFAPLAAHAQERPYFVTYDHYLEEPRNLEIGLSTTTGLPRQDARAYSAPWLELEYGVTGWWTTELYLEGVVTSRDGSGFSGWRVEHRVRPLKTEHRINPVLYFEYEDITEASRIQTEVVGSGALPFEPIRDLRREHARELEGKVILSSAAGAWNIAENIVFEKNLSEAEGVEFGYSVGLSRSLATLASGTSCRFCRERIAAGVEMYGGLGSTQEPGLADTRHFIAPVMSWRVGDRATLRLSAGFGLTQTSDRYLLRVGWAYEMPTRKGHR